MVTPRPDGQASSRTRAGMNELLPGGHCGAVALHDQGAPGQKCGLNWELTVKPLKAGAVHHRPPRPIAGAPCGWPVIGPRVTAVIEAGQDDRPMIAGEVEELLQLAVAGGDAAREQGNPPLEQV